MADEKKKFEIDQPIFTIPKEKKSKAELQKEQFQKAISSVLDRDTKKPVLFPRQFGIIPKGEGAAALGVALTPFMDPIYKKTLIQKLRKKGKLDEQDYLDGYDEIRKGIKQGGTYAMSSIGKLLTMGIDYAFDTNNIKRIDDLANKSLQGDRPDSFVGDLTSLVTEFAVPAGIATKIVNRGKAFDRVKKLNERLGTSKVSKYARKAIEGAAIVGVTDYLAGREGLPTLFNRTAKKMEKTSGLSGKKRAAAVFRNKLRYGFEGTTVGGGFPLLGKGLQLGYKYLGPKFVLNQGLKYGSRGVNNAVFRFPSYLLSKVPTNALVRGTQKLSAYATKKAINPLIKKTFGKDPFKQLPDFEDWRLLSVTSPKIGERSLKRFDNFLSWFRTYGKDPTDVGRARETGQLFVKSRARRFDKTLSALENKSYALAKAFQKRYNTNDTSRASESFYLDKVDDFIKNKIKITELPKELRGFTLDLRKQLDKTLKEFKDYLPKDSEVPKDLKNFLTKNLKNYYVRSFSIFSKPFHVPPQDIRNNAVDWITKNIVTKNRDLREVAVNAYNKNKVNPQQAYRLYADDIVDDILTVGRTDGSNPIERLKQIGTKILRDDKYRFLKTGEELPGVIRKLLGEEKNLRASVLMTTTDAIASSTMKTMMDRIADMGLKNKWLFKSADEARVAYKNPMPINKVPGVGMMKTKLTGLYTSPELVQSFIGTGGFLNRMMQASIYRQIIQFKSAVQAGKTLYSPQTQVRNVTSASIFSLAAGHVGHGGSVPQSMKIVFRDVFKEGQFKNVSDEIAFNDQVEKLIRLGVWDENVVVSELRAVVDDIKKGSLNSFDKIFLKLTEGLSDKVARVYSGGDNLWKAYGFGFERSMLSDIFKNIDEAIKYGKDMGYNISKKDIVTGNAKSFDDILDEISAKTIRDIYPTYSKVPPAVQVLRKLPFSNFVSFSSEMLRTTAKSMSMRLKQIGNDNPMIRQMGYRGLTGLSLALGGAGTGAVKTSLALTGTTKEQWDAYKRSDAAPWDKNANLLAIEPFKNGEAAAVNLSYFSPYDILEKPIQAALNQAATQKINPQDTESYVLDQMFAPEGPVMTLLDPFLSEAIALERVQDVLGAGILIGARGGITGSGSRIYSPSDSLDDKIEKSFAHILKGVAPGVLTSGSKVIKGLRDDVSGSGKPISLQDELIALLSGVRIIRIDAKKNLRFYAAEMNRLNRAADETEKFYKSQNYMDRPPSVMIGEFQQMQDEAFRIQKEFYIRLKDLELLDLNKPTIRKILKDARMSKKMIGNLMRGEFTPINFSEPRFKTKVKNIEELVDRMNKKDKDNVRVVNKNFLYPKGEFRRVIQNNRNKRFFAYDAPYDPGKPREENKPGAIRTFLGDKIPFIGKGSPFGGFGKPETKLPTPPLPETPQPKVPKVSQNVNPATNLTRTETALLSPSEQAIKQKI